MRGIRRAPIESADLRRVTWMDDEKKRRELVEKQVWRCRPVVAPPVVDFANLCV